MIQPVTVREVYYKHKREFEEVFDARLSMFWDGQAGFLMRPFMTQVLEYQGQQPHLAVMDPYGVRGRLVIYKILQDMSNLWAPDYRS